MTLFFARKTIFETFPSFEELMIYQNKLKNRATNKSGRKDLPNAFLEGASDFINQCEIMR